MISVAACLLLLSLALYDPLRRIAEGKTTNAQERANLGVRDVAIPSSASGTPLPLRSKDRPDSLRATVEETESLLKTTIIPEVDWENMTLRETISRLNILLKEAGIPAHQLRFAYDTSGPFPKDTLDLMSVQELKMRNIPLGMLLKYTVGSTKLRYRVSTGKVEFHFSGSTSHPEGYLLWPHQNTGVIQNSSPSDPSVDSVPGDAGDPFAEPGR